MAGGAFYQYHYRSIAFNIPDLTAPEATIPQHSFISQWNLSLPSTDKINIEKSIPFTVVWPEDDQWLMGIKSYLMQHTIIPAVASYYRNSTYFLLMSALPDYGIRLLGKEFGIPLPLNQGINVYLILSPTFSSIQFSVGSVHYSLISNIHPESLIQAAKKIVAAQPAADT